jgi:hypothetical protein
MKLPNDELGRSWCAAKFEEPHSYDDALLTIVTTTPDNQLIVLGNAFPIYAHKKSALCVTAAHNFEYLKQLKAARSLQSHPTLPPDFQIKGTEYFSSEGCFAFTTQKDKSFACRVGQLHYIANYDVAIFEAHILTEEEFISRLALDLSIPKVGDEIALLGHSLEVEGKGTNTGVVKRSLQFWFGVVTSVSFAPNRKKQQFTFETTVPILAGFSGSPILVKPKLGADLTACGVVSFDFSEEKAFKDFTVPGVSTCSMLWPSMGLGFRMTIDEAENIVLLGELLRREILDNKAKHIEIETHSSDEAIEIRFSDKMANPPINSVLKMTAYPK